MSSFGKRSLWGGWIVFAIASITYLLTIEPTASLWDCGEFIATSYKLEVGHPPGTPFFFLINRLAAIFVGDSPLYAAGAMNAMSALESALTIAFLFWSIAHLGRRLYRKEEKELTNSQSWAIIGAAAVGSLAYTFSDTFWFSAVETEVYALSSLFTAVVFWAILKWENVADQPGSNRWLILIAYLMGLSIGAHILNLLAIPAIVFIYYFKKYPGRKKSALWKPGIISILLTGAFYILTPTVVSIGAAVDRMFVNGFGLGVNSGIATFILLLLGAIFWGAYKAQKMGKVGWNTILISAGMVVIGFSTYGIVLIRASVNPPMNSNDPSNPYSLISFLNREQYGKRPLIKGQTYASPRLFEDKSKTTYFVNESGKYSPLERVLDYKYDPNTEIFFPRMFSQEPRHIAEYKRWADVKGKKVRTSTGKTVTVPTFGENLRFFFSYQVNNMYWRYFLWNFVGRQSDIQNEGITQGNWLSGIGPIDAIYLGPQDNLPREMANNKGRNAYYFLPFILGLVGFFFQLKRDGKNFLVVFLLFFMTGLAIILYLNQTPLQPRERDYAYAGSFYAYAIWIGLGLLWVYEVLRKHAFKTNGKMAAALATVLCLSVPTIMAIENWDDHDRSHRYFARDVGRNYLNATLPNAILINYGDNDTFPVWYAQEVEGLRTDVRVMNMSYLGGDWYIDQMRHKTNESAPIPHSLPLSKYYGDALGAFPIQEITKPNGSTIWSGAEVLEWIKSNNPRTKFIDNEGNAYDVMPTRTIAIPVNKERVLKNGIVKPEDAHLIEDTVYLRLKNENVLNIAEMTFLDMLISNDWERPVYFTSYGGPMDYGLVGQDGQGNMFSYLQQEGFLYQLVPIRSEIQNTRMVGRIDTEKLYDNLMNKYQYGNLKDPRVYADDFIQHSIRTSTVRATFAQLSVGLSRKGDTVRAVEVADRAMEELPLGQIRMDEMIPYLVEAYYQAGAFEKGNALAREAGEILMEYIDYYYRFTGKKQQVVASDMLDKWETLHLLYEVVNGHRQNELAKWMEPYLFEPAS